MHDAGKIIVGLAVFLAIATSPLWYHALSGANPTPPQFPVVGESQSCVEPTPYMRTFHMDLLDRWRDEAVRDGDRTYIGLGEKAYEKTLLGTCVNACHSNRDEFCDRCHEYVGATPYCWDCHAEQEHRPLAGNREGLRELASAGAVASSGYSAGKPPSQEE